ncbi:metallophosphoesterase family protein [uncultured Sphingomonas sp.]|uniref:metallophosphoesterase family protein n=1 Tax=uncultured Sphingomonas sp. TaxID=158754 RepID=UPI0035C9A700
MLSKLFRKARGGASPHTAPGERIYAIGDVHGRLDCLDDLLGRIAADQDGRGEMRTTLIFLGDYIDRGPNSRAVVERLMALEGSGTECLFLMGNHEELLLRSAKGDRGSLSTFDRVGGRDTLLSYGVSAEMYDHCSLADLPALIDEHVPTPHTEFLDRAATHHVSGDYLFVHAGVRPGVELTKQKPGDMRWIRDEFLRFRHDFGHFVVHGHTVTPEIDIQANRIGIDLGAYATGRLAAVGLEGADRWFLISDVGGGDRPPATTD